MLRSEKDWEELRTVCKHHYGPNARPILEDIEADEFVDQTWFGRTINDELVYIYHTRGWIVMKLGEKPDYKMVYKYRTDLDEVGMSEMKRRLKNVLNFNYV